MNIAAKNWFFISFSFCTALQKKLAQCGVPLANSERIRENSLFRTYLKGQCHEKSCSAEALV